MITAGIIAEYNPFHNGHKYQLDMIKRECGAVIAVMSGHFTQRGDIAVTDKWTRAKAAVINGCDLVLELPVCIALSSAADFAYGGISLLDRLNIVDRLYFGSEDGDVSRLTKAAYLLSHEPTEVSALVRKYVSDGLSYPAAYERAWNGAVDSDLLTKPNNILALEYIKSLTRLKSKIIPCAVKRAGAEHDGEPLGNIASASYIRGLISENADYSAYVPESAHEIYESSDMSYDISRLDSFITGFLRLSPASRIKAPESLGNRIKAAAAENYGFEKICAAAKSKLYTMSRIRRTILASALDLPAPREPMYARVLAMNDTGRSLLREIKEKSNIEIVAKTASHNKADEMFGADIRATDIFGMCSAAPYASGRDYTESPVII